MAIGYCEHCKKYGGHTTDCALRLGETPWQLKAEIAKLREQLAAVTRELDERDRQVAKLYQSWIESQAREAKLREALKSCHTKERYLNQCHEQCGGQQSFNEQKVNKTLFQQFYDTALHQWESRLIRTIGDEAQSNGNTVLASQLYARADELERN